MLVGKLEITFDVWRLGIMQSSQALPVGKLLDFVGSQLVFGEESICEKGIKDIRAPKVGFVEISIK